MQLVGRIGGLIDSVDSGQLMTWTGHNHHTNVSLAGKLQLLVMLEERSASHKRHFHFTFSSVHFVLPD
jgi:hypothetical protein